MATIVEVNGRDESSCKKTRCDDPDALVVRVPRSRSRAKTAFRLSSAASEVIDLQILTPHS